MRSALQLGLLLALSTFLSQTSILIAAQFTACQDLNPNCPEWTAQGGCTGGGGFSADFPQVCPASCNACGTAGTAPAIQPAVQPFVPQPAVVRARAHAHACARTHALGRPAGRPAARPHARTVRHARTDRTHVRAYTEPPQTGCARCTPQVPGPISMVTVVGLQIFTPTPIFFQQPVTPAVPTGGGGYIDQNLACSARAH